MNSERKCHLLPCLPSPVDGLTKLSCNGMASLVPTIISARGDSSPPVGRPHKLLVPPDRRLFHRACMRWDLSLERRPATAGDRFCNYWAQAVRRPELQFARTHSAGVFGGKLSQRELKRSRGMPPCTNNVGVRSWRFQLEQVQVGTSCREDKNALARVSPRPAPSLARPAWEREWHWCLLVPVRESDAAVLGPSPRRLSLQSQGRGRNLRFAV
mmetsp:Transcript_35530/g.101645  ORF Transcript_35530/g.101645 Transcript_35530/m.101645 type:complete len:213 (+) Transcript_35530:80-718(+)